MGRSAWRTDQRASKDGVLPLLSNTTVIEQPVDLNKLSVRYADFAIEFIKRESEAGTPWLLYFAFNHVHVPNFATMQYCNSTKRGLFGDALAELDNAVGATMQAVVNAGQSV